MNPFPYKLDSWHSSWRYWKASGCISGAIVGKLMFFFLPSPESRKSRRGSRENTEYKDPLYSQYKDPLYGPQYTNVYKIQNYGKNQ